MNLVGCGQVKKKGARTAFELYNGSFTRQIVKYLRSRGESYCYLSAKYGIVKPTDKIELYDSRVSDLSLEGVRSLREIVTKQLAGVKSVVLYAGTAYKQLLPSDVQVHEPFVGLDILQRKRLMSKNKTEVEVTCVGDTPQIDYSRELDDLPVGVVKSHFLDSGSFSLWTKAAEFAKSNDLDEWAYYHTDDFYSYMDDYANFVKKYAVGIDHYANVDAIPNPKLTWRNQKYLESEHGLSPVPVVHYKTDLKWLRRYVESGYDFIALGGLVGSTSQEDCRRWIDDCFDYVCDTPSRLPRVKLHGFGVTTYSLLLRYPWFSVDSTSWTKIGAYGGILIPHRRGGEWVFTEEPYLMKVSLDSPDLAKKGKHYHSMTAREKEIIQAWLDHIGVPLGRMGTNGEVAEFGVTTRHTERRAANLHFFELMRRSLPTYPWPFRSTKIKGFGLGLRRT